MCFIKEQTQNYNEITNVTTLEFFLMLHSAAQSRAKTTRCFPTPGIKSTAWQWTFCSISLCFINDLYKICQFCWLSFCCFRRSLQGYFEEEISGAISMRLNSLGSSLPGNPSSAVDPSTAGQTLQVSLNGSNWSTWDTLPRRKIVFFPFWDSSPQTETLHFYFWNLPLHQIQSKRFLMGFLRG